MSLDGMRLFRNVLLRTALISLILAWMLAALTIGLWDFWTAITSQWFRTPVADLGPFISSWFGLIKFYMIFVLLAPALGIHWEIRRRESKKTS
jgi:hypothetical protein